MKERGAEYDRIEPADDAFIDEIEKSLLTSIFPLTESNPQYGNDVVARLVKRLKATRSMVSEVVERWDFDEALALKSDDVVTYREVGSLLREVFVNGKFRTIARRRGFGCVSP